MPLHRYPSASMLSLPTMPCHVMWLESTYVLRWVVSFYTNDMLHVQNFSRYQNEGVAFCQLGFGFGLRFHRQINRSTAFLLIDADAGPGEMARGDVWAHAATPSADHLPNQRYLDSEAAPEVWDGRWCGVVVLCLLTTVELCGVAKDWKIHRIKTQN